MQRMNFSIHCLLVSDTCTAFFSHFWVSLLEEDNTEQQAIDLACSRLQPLTCRWNGCNVDLNSINALIQHLEQHKPSSSSNDVRKDFWHIQSWDVLTWYDSNFWHVDGVNADEGSGTTKNTWKNMHYYRWSVPSKVTDFHFDRRRNFTNLCVS